MSKKEILYRFTLPKEVETEIPFESINEAGDKVITQKKSKEVKNYTFGVFKASRGLKEDADIYRAGQFGKCIDAGLITVALLEKKYLNSGGVFSDEEQKARKDLYEKLFKSNKELRDLELKETKSEEDKAQISSLTLDNEKTINSIIEIEGKAQSLFENSAEAIARNRTILYYATFLAAKQNDKGEFEELFNGKLEDRFEQLDVLEAAELPSIELQAFSYAWGIIGLWYNNPKLTQLEIDKYLAPDKV